MFFKILFKERNTFIFKKVTINIISIFVISHIAGRRGKVSLHWNVVYLVSFSSATTATAFMEETQFAYLVNGTGEWRWRAIFVGCAVQRVSLTKLSILQKQQFQLEDENRSEIYVRWAMLIKHEPKSPHRGLLQAFQKMMMLQLKDVLITIITSIVKSTTVSNFPLVEKRCRRFGFHQANSSQSRLSLGFSLVLSLILVVNSAKVGYNNRYRKRNYKDTTERANSTDNFACYCFRNL